MRERQPDENFHHSGSLVMAVVSIPLPGTATTLHANLGWQRERPARQQTTVWSAGLEHTLNDKVALTADLFGSDRDTHPWAQLGLRWHIVPEQLTWHVALARQSGGSTATTACTGLTLGF